jgi:hypothetical protein
MNHPLLVIFAILTLGALYVVLPVVAEAYRRYRGAKRPVCPETGEPAEITLDARHAALTAALGRPHLHVESCSRWPESHGCDQRCTGSIDSARL